MNRSPITIESQHGDMVVGVRINVLDNQHDAQLDYYGKILATCSSDNRIRVYNVDNGSSELLVEIAE